MSKSFILNIKGYYRDEVRTKFPKLPGIYFVYRGVLNNITRTCILRELIFIGETVNLHDRFNDHDRRPDFLASINNEETLLYSFALKVSSDSDRRRIAQSLIYELNPQLNRRLGCNYQYPETIIEITGDRHAFIPRIIKAPSY